MKNKFIIYLFIGIIIFGGISMVFTHYYPVSASFFIEKQMLLAQIGGGNGAWDIIRCGLAYAQCASSLAECKIRADNIIGRCLIHYNRNVERCERIIVRNEESMRICRRNKERLEKDHQLRNVRCGEENSRCIERANTRYRINPNRLATALERCNNQRFRCISNTVRRRDAGLNNYERCKDRVEDRIVINQQRHIDCLQRTRDRKLDCRVRATTEIQRVVGRCIDGGDRCVERVNSLCR